jgi:hypothetical protein
MNRAWTFTAGRGRRRGEVIAGYRLVYTGNEKKANEALVTDSVQAGPGGSLLFDTVRYVKTSRFDAASLKKIEAYRAEAGVE